MQNILCLLFCEDKKHQKRLKCSIRSMIDIGSAPIKEGGAYSQRGATYVLVYRINKNAEKTKIDATIAKWMHQAGALSS